MPWRLQRHKQLGKYHEDHKPAKYEMKLRLQLLPILSTRHDETSVYNNMQ